MCSDIVHVLLKSQLMTFYKTNTLQALTGSNTDAGRCCVLLPCSRAHSQACGDGRPHPQADEGESQGALCRKS